MGALGTLWVVLGAFRVSPGSLGCLLGDFLLNGKVFRLFTRGLHKDTQNYKKCLVAESIVAMPVAVALAAVAVVVSVAVAVAVAVAAAVAVAVAVAGCGCGSGCGRLWLWLWLWLWPWLWLRLCVFCLLSPNMSLP